MVRVGFVRWLIQCGMKPENGGMTRIEFQLVPQANTYHSLVKEWYGTSSSLVEKDIPVEAHECAMSELTYDLNPARLMQCINQLASELADKVINYCMMQGIVDYQEYNKAAANYIVKTALVNAARDNHSDPLERVEWIDLVQDMRAGIEARRAAAIERARAATIAFEQHQREMEARYAEQAKANTTSFELLYSMLNATEIEEAKKKNQVTVKTILGDFIVPVPYGLVKQFVEGKYKASYCVVFEDPTIPCGDEVLMKIALLKTDPARFLKVGNKFHERNGLWLEA